MWKASLSDTQHMMDYTEHAQSMEKLKNQLLHRIEKELQTEDEFIPFGMILTSTGEYRLLTISDKDEEYSPDKAVSQLKAHIDKSVTDSDDSIVGGYCQDFLINDHDAIHLNLISKVSEGWITCYLPYFIQPDRSIEYGSIILSD